MFRKIKNSSDGSERTYIQGSSENISQNGSNPEREDSQDKPRSPFEITEEKREKMKSAVSKIRARKREKKMMRRNKEAIEKEKSSLKGSNSTLSEETKSNSDKIFPQK